MGFRCWQHALAFFATVILTNILATHSAPAFKVKHYSYFKPKGFSAPARSERRLVGGSSPIHFISPIVSHNIKRFEDFFVPPPMPVQPFGEPRSSIYKLPLQLLANGKPHTIIKGFPHKHQQTLDFYPKMSSNIIKLPLKFMTNGKPVRVLIKDRELNHLRKSISNQKMFLQKM